MVLLSLHNKNLKSNTGIIGDSIRRNILKIIGKNYGEILEGIIGKTKSIIGSGLLCLECLD